MTEKFYYLPETRSSYLNNVSSFLLTIQSARFDLSSGAYALIYLPKIISYVESERNEREQCPGEILMTYV